MSLEQPDYGNIFASSAATGELLTMPTSSYVRGWGYLNEAEPPPMEFFNYLQNLADERAGYLFAASLVRKMSTSYSAGEIATSPNLAGGLMLVCATAGITASEEPDFTDVAAGDEITDGSCVWAVRERPKTSVIVSEDEPSGQLEGDAWIEVTA